MVRCYLLCLLLLCSTSAYISLNVQSHSKRSPFLNIKSISKHFATAVIGSLLLFPAFPANAFGPVEIPLSILSYKEVPLCNGQKPIMPGQKAGEGLFPVCIEVDVEV